MTVATTREIADTLAGFCRSGDTDTGLDTLYGQDVVSVEAMAMPGTDSRETRGLAALRGKHAWWNGAMEEVDNSAQVEGPFMHGDDRFALIFSGRWRDKASGQEMEMHEVGVYTVTDGKITREEFFYTM